MNKQEAKHGDRNHTMEAPSCLTVGPSALRAWPCPQMGFQGCYRTMSWDSHSGLGRGQSPQHSEVSGSLTQQPPLVSVVSGIKIKCRPTKPCLQVKLTVWATLHPESCLCIENCNYRTRAIFSHLTCYEYFPCLCNLLEAIYSDYIMFWTCHDSLYVFLLLEIKVSGRSFRPILTLVDRFVFLRRAVQRWNDGGMSDVPYLPAS